MTTAAAASQAANTEAAAAEPVKLKIWAPDNIRIEDWETNAMTKWLEEEANVDLEVIPLSSEDYTTKVNISLTAGAIEELPDIIINNSKGFSDSMIWSWAQAEAIIPLTEYCENPELAVHINEAKERTGIDYMSQIVSPDGNIYCIPRYNQSYGNEFPGKLWIYKPWLDALGKDVPTTTEEYYELLKLIYESDMNGNGKADEIGMIGTTTSGKYYRYWSVLMNAFVYAGDDQYRSVDNGVVSAAYVTNEWKEGLKYLKKMFAENLILTESLTMSDDQFKSLMNSEEPVVFSFVYAAPDMITSGSQRSMEYVGIDTLTGPNGVNYSTLNPSVSIANFVITANCKNPEVAFRVGDLMSSEYIGISQRWGEEGVDWDYASNVADTSAYKPSVEGFDMSIIAYDDGTFWGGTEVTNGSWRQTGPYVRQYGIANGWAIANDGTDEYTLNNNAAAYQYQNSDHEPAEVIPKLIYTEDESNEIAEIESILKSYVDESMGLFMTGAKDIDAEWDNYLKEIDKIGLDKYLEVVQGVYDRMYK